MIQWLKCSLPPTVSGLCWEPTWTTICRITTTITSTPINQRPRLVTTLSIWAAAGIRQRLICLHTPVCPIFSSSWTSQRKAATLSAIWVQRANCSMELKDSTFSAATRLLSTTKSLRSTQVRSCWFSALRRQECRAICPSCNSSQTIWERSTSMCSRIM